jgi:putative hydrolase of the HAD superfamily
MTVKTVFFDMGGTIDTFWYTPEMRLQQTPGLQHLLSFHGINLHLSDEQLYKLVTDGLARYHQWRLVTLEELPVSVVWRKYILGDYTDSFPQLDVIADNLMVWIETQYYRRQMRPEIPAVLADIQKRGYKIGLISNVTSRGQVPLNLTQYGIIDYFNPIVLSSEYKRRKPDPAIFHYAARLSNSPTSECIYIGDRISRDVLGARRAGFKLAIQIRHDFIHGESDDGATPDLILNNMTELLDVLDRDANSQKEIRLQEPPENQIRAALFDADGVLYYRQNKDQEFNLFLKQYGCPGKYVPDSEINPFRHQAFIGQITFEQYKTTVLNLYGITDPDLVSRGIEIVKREKDQIQFFSDTRATLELLKNRNMYLGIVTDTAQPLHVKINKLERGGIGHLWDSITPSSEVGVQKPDPRIYQLATQQLGVPAVQTVFVGHKSSELEGARNAGMKTVAFNYEFDAIADYYIDHFADLAKLPILSELYDLQNMVVSHEQGD